MNLLEKIDLRLGLIRLFIALGTGCIAGNAGAAPTVADIVAESGCAMAHCDQGMTDNNRLTADLSGGVVDFWRDRRVNGSLIGLGCVANSSTAVCSFKSSLSKPVEIKAYAIDGTSLWSSTALSSQAYNSAPIIGPLGDVIAADERRIIRFGPGGETVWSRPTAGGVPISPNVTDDGNIILATKGGPVSAYDFVTGALIAQLRLDDTIRIGRRTYQGFFDTINTPSIKGNRIYISTRFLYGGQPSGLGRLYALDLIRENGVYRLQIAWYYAFGAPSGTSPTLAGDEEGNTVIYFDGSGIAPFSANPAALAVRDFGDSGELLWAHPMSTLPQSSPALDPRGGAWYYAFGGSDLVRIDNKGNTIQTIDVDAIVDDDTATFRPYSPMTISEDVGSGNPVMFVSATTPDESITYILAIDLAAESLLWQYRIDEGRGSAGGASGQYAMLINDQGEPVLVFKTHQNGVWGLVVGREPAVAPGLTQRPKN